MRVIVYGLYDYDKIVCANAIPDCARVVSDVLVLHITFVRKSHTQDSILTSITSRSHDDKDDADQSSLLTVTVVSDARIPPLHCGDNMAKEPF